MVYTIKAVEKKQDMKYWVIQGMRDFCVEGKENSVHQWNIRAEYLKRPSEQQINDFIRKYHVYNVIISCFKNGLCLEQH